MYTPYLMFCGRRGQQHLTLYRMTLLPSMPLCSLTLFCSRHNNVLTPTPCWYQWIFVIYWYRHSSSFSSWVSLILTVVMTGIRHCQHYQSYNALPMSSNSYHMAFVWHPFLLCPFKLGMILHNRLCPLLLCVHTLFSYSVWWLIVHKKTFSRPTLIPHPSSRTVAWLIVECLGLVLGTGMIPMSMVLVTSALPILIPYLKVILHSLRLARLASVHSTRKLAFITWLAILSYFLC